MKSEAANLARKNWTPLWLAQDHCRVCKGEGFRVEEACACVLRAACRTALKQHESSKKVIPFKARGFATRAEFRADIAGIARQALTEAEYKTFNAVFLEKKSWPEASGGLDRGNYFHMVYRVEQKCGRAFIDAGLFPYETYFRRSRPVMALDKPARATPPRLGYIAFAA